jgi:hypothetical protein
LDKTQDNGWNCNGRKLEKNVSVEQLILSKILEFPGLDVKIAILIYVKNV